MTVTLYDTLNKERLMYFTNDDMPVFDHRPLGNFLKSFGLVIPIEQRSEYNHKARIYAPSTKSTNLERSLFKSAMVAFLTQQPSYTHYQWRVESS